MLVVKYFKWKTFQNMSHGLKIWDSWKTARKKYFNVYSCMCAIKEAFNQKTSNFYFLFLFLNSFFVYMLYLKLFCSPSSNKPSSSSLLAFSVKYSAKCKHCYVCLRAMAQIVQASASWMQNRQGTAVCLLEPRMFLFTNPGARQGPLLEAVLFASLLHSAYVWVCVKERTTSLHVQQATKEILNNWWLFGS